jgi:acyl phosphate:glycerol-3-phosphate acyltransferase
MTRERSGDPGKARGGRRRRLPVGLQPGELKRKAIHVATLVVPLVYLDHPLFFFGFHVTRKQASLTLALVLLALLVLEVVRLRARVFRHFFHQLLGDALRRRERSELLGATYLVMGFLFTVLAFERPVAVAACEFLVLGDTAAALVGKSLGRVPAFDKTAEGSVACLLVCGAVGWALSASVPGFPLHVALAGALVATLFELLPVPLDDNLRIPLSAGLVMHFLLA